MFSSILFPSKRWINDKDTRDYQGASGKKLPVWAFTQEDDSKRCGKEYDYIGHHLCTRWANFLEQ